MKTRIFEGRSRIVCHNGDCMEALDAMEPNQYDLAIVDPPYGLGNKLTSGGTWAAKYTSDDSKWDVSPSREYFRMLLLNSENYIIWGGNYFSENITPARCFIVWRKLQMLGMHTMADCELALTSFDANAKIYDGANTKNRIHPTQKPVALYKWLLQNYAKPGDKILDTHGGSMSLAIACWDMGFDLDVWELDEDYFREATDRIEKHTRQMQFDFEGEQ